MVTHCGLDSLGLKAMGVSHHPIQRVPIHFWGYSGWDMALTTHPLFSTKVEEKVELHRFLSVLSWQVIG